ncbi:hypothetical protein ALC60_09813 [Trachymyrmex zeteki]|uniref:Uncharacterized protein n=1 Tax=Mycetomoellerius zeteki TaxID=64791 RepID=A0A151WT99_9HYME|nr:hypothetical protein ALC60_09813 [Trachymyrmex zeteki]
MDGIVPPTSTRQPFGLYAATSAKGITADRTARKKKYFLTNSSRQFYVKQFRKTDFDHFTFQTGDDDKNRCHGLFQLCKKPRQAKQSLTNRQRFFISFLSSKKSSRNQDEQRTNYVSWKFIGGPTLGRQLLDTHGKSRAPNHSGTTWDTVVWVNKQHGTSWDHQQRYYPLF